MASPTNTLWVLRGNGWLGSSLTRLGSNKGRGSKKGSHGGSKSSMSLTILTYHSTTGRGFVTFPAKIADQVWKVAAWRVWRVRRWDLAPFDSDSAAASRLYYMVSSSAYPGWSWPAALQDTAYVGESSVVSSLFTRYLRRFLTQTITNFKNYIWNIHFFPLFFCFFQTLTFRCVFIF